MFFDESSIRENTEKIILVNVIDSIFGLNRFWSVKVESRLRWNFCERIAA
jgi:hypothetical protein